jgi:hypothetical protein
MRSVLKVKAKPMIKKKESGGCSLIWSIGLKQTLI